MPISLTAARSEDTETGRRGTFLAACVRHEVHAMDTFFVRKQIVVGAILFTVVEIAVMLVRAFAN